MQLRAAWAPPCFYVAWAVLPPLQPLRTPAPATSAPWPPLSQRGNSEAAPLSAATSGGALHGGAQSCSRKPARRVRSWGAQEGESAVSGCPSGPDDHHVTPSFPRSHSSNFLLTKLLR